VLDIIHKIKYDIDIFVKLNWFKAPKFQEINLFVPKSIPIDEKNNGIPVCD